VGDPLVRLRKGIGFLGGSSLEGDWGGKDRREPMFSTCCIYPGAKLRDKSFPPTALYFLDHTEMSGGFLEERGKEGWESGRA